MNKRILSVLLVLVMLMSLFPSSVLAVGDRNEQARIMSDDMIAAAPAEEPGEEPGKKDDVYETSEDTEIAMIGNVVGSTTVSVTGELPKGARLSLEPMGDAAADYRAAIEKTGVVFTGDPMVLDITVVDENGVPYQPSGKPLQLTFRDEQFSDSTRVWHFEGMEPTPLYVEPETGAITVYTYGFSVYAVGNVREGMKSVRGAKGVRAADDGEKYSVDFLDRNSNLVYHYDCDPGEVLTLPAPPSRDGYTGYWAVAREETSGGQTTIVEGDRITGDTVTVTEDGLRFIAGYDKIVYTVTFYSNEEKTEVLAEKPVDIDTSFCLNDIPLVPIQSGHTGRWVYSGGNFNNSVVISENTDVWAAYDQSVFTVTFKVGESTYRTETFYTGDQLTLPADPTVEGKDFRGWFDENSAQHQAGEAVTANLTLYAMFNDQYSVSFVVLADDGETVLENLKRYIADAGTTIGVMPQAPFVSGKVFEKWVNKDTGDTVTADTVVNNDIVAVAQFRTVQVYEITAQYYYVGSSGEVVFNTDLLQVEAHELPYTITAPSTTQTDPNEVSGGPIYYPETPTVTVEEDDFDSEKKYTVRIKYVPFTAEYDFVYMLKDLTGDGYTEIDRTHVQGVLNSYVTPTVKNYDHYTLELAQGAEITQASGQELVVKYTRKYYTLSYDSTGGSYVGGGTHPYGATVAVSGTTPTRDGYTFAGWYLDEGLTQEAESSINISGDTVLYAKWNGAQVNYTIIYMKEAYDNATGTTSWVYENSRNDQGTVGQTVYAASAPAITLNGYEKTTAVNGTNNSAGTGADTAVVISPDGSTTLKVYYSLIRYTLVFNLNNNNGRITMNGQTYTGSDYRVTGVVLGQDVSSMWPSSSNEVYSTATTGNRYFIGWTGAGSTYVTKRYELIWDNISQANNQHVMTFTASWDNDSSDRDAHYWLQQPDGTWAVADEYTQTGLNTTSLGPKNIDGYTQHNGDASRPNNNYPNSGNIDVQVWVDEYTDTYTDGGDHNSATPNNSQQTVTRTVDGTSYTYTFDHAERYTSWGRTRYRYVYTATIPGHNRTVQKYVYNFYYDRASYQIDYKYGTTALKTESGILFEANINTSTYNYTPARPSGIDSDYTWGGWYADSELQTTYTFNTMPGHNLILYAKWVAPTFTVSFNTDGGSSVDSQTVEKYKKAAAPEASPTKSGYVFDGWYTTADGNTLYDWNTQITADTTVYAHWTQKTLSYTVNYVDEAGVAVATSHDSAITRNVGISTRTA